MVIVDLGHVIHRSVLLCNKRTEKTNHFSTIFVKHIEQPIMFVHVSKNVIQIIPYFLHQRDLP